MSVIQSLPPQLTHFAIAAVLSFVIGLELHSYRRAVGHDLGFGTTRTLTLVGILGYILWTVEPTHWLYCVGLGGFSILLAIYYALRAHDGQYSLLSILIALLIFLVGPMVETQPFWFPILALVVISFLLGDKPGIRRLSDTIRVGEAATLAKFLILSALILPLLPSTAIPMVSITWHQLWLAVIVVSGISYCSYLLQTYLFPGGSVLLTGVLGGLYSSTAATVVLSRRAHDGAVPVANVAPALIMATAMMYLRLWVIILVLGHRSAAIHLALPFGVLLVSSVAFAGWLYHRLSPHHMQREAGEVPHPLELPTAFLFAFLFVFFAGVTQLVINGFGESGLRVMSFATGFTDIDPFILSLLAGKYPITQHAVEVAIIIASGSNNLLKAAYAALLARRREIWPAVIWLALLMAASLAFVLFPVWPGAG